MSRAGSKRYIKEREASEEWRKLAIESQKNILKKYGQKMVK